MGSLMTSSSIGSAAVVPLPAPRRCWLLIEDVDTGEWEIADFETREAIAIAMSAPQWDSHGHAEAPLSEGVLLTWTPGDGDSCFLWVAESDLYWSEAAARQAARQLTAEMRAKARVERRRASRQRRRSPPEKDGADRAVTTHAEAPKGTPTRVPSFHGSQR